jgi:hypothetical protein
VLGELEKFYYHRDVLVGVSAQEKFIDEIVSKADGVFLWVSLALHDVLRGLSKHDTFDELLHRVSMLLIDIERLYEDMLHRLGEDEQLYRQEAASYFKMFLRFTFLDLVSYALSVRKLIQNLPPLPSSDVHLHDLLRQCHRTELRIASCCAGILQITGELHEREIDDDDIYEADSQNKAMFCRGKDSSQIERSLSHTALCSIFCSKSLLDRKSWLVVQQMMWQPFAALSKPN